MSFVAVVVNTSNPFQTCSRTDLSEVLESQLTTQVMLVAGSLASHLHTVHTMASHMDKTKSTLVIIDGIGDVLLEAVILGKTTDKGQMKKCCNTNSL